MTAEILSSNVMNYLVWRYLQESGYDSAAIQLSRAWCQHPDALPFASNVKPHGLINLVQDGLWLDQIKAKVEKADRRYVFGDDHGPRYAVRTSSRSGSESLEQRKSRAAQLDGPGPNGVYLDGSRVGGKGKRRSYGDRRSNGDAMEIDTNGIREGVSPEVESPAMETVPSTIEVGDSVALLTEKPVDLTQTTTFLYSNGAETNGASNESVVFRETHWSPTEPKVLTTAVDNKIRFYVMDGKPAEPPPSTCSISLEQPVALQPFHIEHICWTQSGDAFIAGIEHVENQMLVGKLLHLDHKTLDVKLISSSVSTVMALCWNEKAKQLLVVSTNDLTGAIGIWQPGSNEPIRTILTATATMNAVWISDTKFAACGLGLIAIYDTKTEPAIQAEINTDIDWETIRFDPVSELVALASEGGKHLGIVSDYKTLTVHNTQQDPITRIEFQPIPNPSSLAPTAPRLLATATATGIVEIIDARAPFHVIHRFFMGGFPAASMAFSPDGFLLAAAGDEAVLVWNPETGGLPKAIWKWPQEDRAWAPEPNPELELDDGQTSLCWDVDGKKIAYTLRHQIAVIDFR